MNIATVIVAVLLLVLVGAFPSWPYSQGWGYVPSGVLGVIILVLIILLVLRRI